MAVACLVCVVVLVIERAGLGPVAAALLLVAAITCGLVLGAERLDQIRTGALVGPEGSEIEIAGFLTDPPRRSSDGWRLFISTDRGRVAVTSGRLPAGGPISTGDRISTTGTLRDPPEWLSGYLDRQGISMVLEARSVRSVPGRRGWPAGWIDSIRTRAETALGFGIGDAESALARGFVLGQDQSIEPEVVDRFRASGLAHLLAVSGQNILLLSILAMPFLALLGLPLRVRLMIVIGLIALYVPVAGAGPSIQRAGIMGVAALAAVASARPAMRSWLLALAAAVTLTLDPLAIFDAGWQLSFAAVAGIMIFARPLARSISSAIPFPSSGIGSALVDGVAVTTAASVTTLPLIAFHFEAVPITTLGANLVAMPAVAPSMWLGMTAAALGQLHPFLALPLNLANAVLLSFISEVAAVAGADGASVGTSIPGPGLLIVALAAAAAVLGLLIRFPKVLVWAVVAAIAIPAIILTGAGRRDLAKPPPGGLRVEMLDIGQGDAFLIRSYSGRSLLVDTGPPGGGIGEALESAGIGRLDGVVLTHLDLDHVGGFVEVLRRFEVESVFLEESDPSIRSAIESEGAAVRRLAAGDRLDLDPGRLTVISPPQGMPQSTDRNARSIVLVLESLGYRMLLTGDAESEEVKMLPGDLDVLKLAHHGSRDEGIVDLLAATRPAIGLISAGKDNRYGHPDPSTIEALEVAGVRILRTDLDGTVSVVFSERGLGLEWGR